MFEMILPFLALLISLTLAAVIIIPYFYGALWYPVPKKVARHALELCKPSPGETLYDLGCGDGRVLLIGAKEFGLKGVGVEIDPIKTWFARWRIKNAKLSSQISIERRNAIGFNIGQADVIFIYLSHQAIDQLLPTLKKQMKSGARLVSYRFCLKGEVPDKFMEHVSIFLYKFNKGKSVNIYS